MGHILVVEDDPDIRECVTVLLSEEGYRVVEASNGAEALAALRNSSEKPCLILLDLMMPVMNGWEFRSAQRADPALSRIPVVVLTGAAEIEEVVTTLAVEDCLRKPFEFAPLLERIRRHCMMRTA